MMKKTAILFLFASSAFAAQYFRVDPQSVTTTAGNTPPGGYPTLYAVPNATIALCTDAACSIPAIAYTDGTGNTACPSYAPVTLPGTTVCTSTTGPQGQFGFWVIPGTYYYTITLTTGQRYGSFPFTSNTAGVTQLTAGPGISVTSGGIGSVTVSNTGVLSFNGRTGAVVPVAGDYPVALGGTGLTTCNTNGWLFGNGTSPFGCTSAGSQYQVAQAGASGVPTVGPVHIDQAAAITGNLPATNGGTGAGSPTAHTVPVAQGASPYNFVSPGAAGGVYTSNGTGADPTFQPIPSAFPSGTQTQYLRIQPNTGNNTTLQFNLNSVALNTADYNFPPQTPNTPITATFASTITMAPCPLGVAGTHTVAGHLPQLLSIQGGAGGAAESVAIQGGTCTGDGVTSGTVIFTPVNNHSAAWTLNSNSAGIQECIYVAGPTGACHIPGGNTVLIGNIPGTAAAVTIPSGYSTSLRGVGRLATILLTGGTTGDWISLECNSPCTSASGGGGDLEGFSMLDSTNTPHTAGAMIRMRYRSDNIINDLFLNYAYDGIVAEGNVRFNHRNFTVGTSHIGYYVTCNNPTSGQANYPDCLSYGSVVAPIISSATSGTNAIRVEAPMAGVTIDSPNTGSASNTANVSVVTVAVGTNPWNELTIGGACILDGHAVGFEAIGNGSTYTSNSITVTGCRITAAINAVFASDFVQGLAVTNSVLTGGIGGSGLGTAIQLNGNVRNSEFSNNPEINADGSACLAMSGIQSGIDFSGNICGQRSIEAERPTSALALSGTLTNFNVRGNWLASSGTLIANSATITGWSMANNTGIDDVIPPVNSAATLPFPVNPIFTVGGSTNFTAVTFPLISGSRGMLTTTAATLTATVGATIGNSYIFRQNVPASWYWDGTKIWFSGQDPGLSNTYTFIGTETGANNAIVGALPGVTLAAGLQVTVKLGHTLQAGANTFNLNGGGAVAIKSSRNVANDIGTAYVATGTIVLLYDGTEWVDVSQ